MKKLIRDRIELAQRHGSGTPARIARVVTVTVCRMCQLPTKERQRADRELLEDSVSLGAIAQRTGVSKSAVKRHRDRHLRPAAIAEVQRIENREVEPEPTPETTTEVVPRHGGPIPDIRRGVRPVVERLYEKCAQWADRALDDASWPMFVACVREARQSAELVARLNGELQQTAAQPPSNTYVILVPGGAPLPPGPVIDVEIIEPDPEGSALEAPAANVLPEGGR